MRPASRVLVTGAAGFIGSHLVRRLVAEGHQVVGLDDLSTGSTDALGDVPEVRFVEGDVCDLALVQRLAQGCASIFHQAALRSVQLSIHEPVRTTRTNVLGTLNVLLAAERADATVVCASSSSVYGEQEHYPVREEATPDPRSPYASSKLAGEAYCRAMWRSAGVRVVALRYFNVFGPGQDPASEYAAVIPRFVTACLGGDRPVIDGDGEQGRDFTYVDDAATANLLAARAPEEAFGRVFNVGGGRPPISILELLARVAAICEVEPDPVHAPPRPGDIRSSHADLSRSTAVLGYRPDVSIDDGLRRTVTSFRERVTSAAAR